jgi:hypothetical protein
MLVGCAFMFASASLESPWFEWDVKVTKIDPSNYKSQLYAPYHSDSWTVTSMLGEFPEKNAILSWHILSNKYEFCDEDTTVTVIHPLKTKRLDRFVRLALKIMIWGSTVGFALLILLQLVHWFRNPKNVMGELSILVVFFVSVTLVLMSIGPIISYPSFGNALVIDPGCPKSLAITVSLRGLVPQGVSFMGLGLVADLAAVFLTIFPWWAGRNEIRE